MTTTTKVLIGIFSLIVVGVVLLEIAVWKECLVANSWWYCLRILG